MQIGATTPLSPLARPNGPALPAPVMKKIDESAKSFESMFMSQMMQFMWSGDAGRADETFGGGHGEEMWRGMLVQEFGKISSEGQGMGIASSVRDQMIRMQQAQMLPQPISETAHSSTTPDTDPTQETAR